MKSMFYLLASTGKIELGSGKIKPGDIGYDPSITVANDQVVANIMNVVYLVAGMVAVLVIVAAGFIYVTSNGDANKIGQAKQAVLYSVIGLVVVLMAFVITQFVLGKI